MAGTLYMVSTPIGNLEDITHRALRILGEVDLIACEDTRHTRKLLNHYGIKTRTISYYEQNERERAGELIDLVKSGKDVAVVSDAGTPGISDPGFRVIRLGLEKGIQVVPIPGATALISALVVSGLPSDQFFFGGFLPARSSQRRIRLKELSSIPATLVFYEAPHRIVESLRDAREILGERHAVIARELTKLHEEILRGRLSELANRLSEASETRGEIVLIVDRNLIDDTIARDDSSEIGPIVAALETDGNDPRTALKKAAKKLGISRDEAYRRLSVERAREKR